MKVSSNTGKFKFWQVAGGTSLQMWIQKWKKPKELVWQLWPAASGKDQVVKWQSVMRLRCHQTGEGKLEGKWIVHDIPWFIWLRMLWRICWTKMERCMSYHELLHQLVGFSTNSLPLPTFRLCLWHARGQPYEVSWLFWEWSCVESRVFVICCVVFWITKQCFFSFLRHKAKMCVCMWRWQVCLLHYEEGVCAAEMPRSSSCIVFPRWTWTRCIRRIPRRAPSVRFGCALFKPKISM